MAYSCVQHRRNPRTSERATRRETAAGLIYTTKFRWLTRCIYCGLPASSLDHVFPVASASQLETWRPAVRKALGQGMNAVPCCRECNSIAGGNPFISIRAKRDFIQDRLRKRLATHLNMPDWSEEEIEDLSPAMRGVIRAGQVKQREASMRCNWPLIR